MLYQVEYVIIFWVWFRSALVHADSAMTNARFNSSCADSIHSPHWLYDDPQCLIRAGLGLVFFPRKQVMRLPEEN